MLGIQVMTFHLLLFIAYHVVNPANERDIEALGRYREFIESVIESSEEDL